MKRYATLLLPILTVILAGSGTELPGQPAQTPPRVALVLSGGGARGVAHVGVLKSLEEGGVPIDFIVGTSFGALVGGLYSVGYSPSDIELLLRRVDWDELFDDTPERPLVPGDAKARFDRGFWDLRLREGILELPAGLASGQKVEQLLARFTALEVAQAGNDYDRLPTPFRAVATDLLSGKPHIFGRGPMSRAIRASIAIPGVFTPVETPHTLLVDGGIASNIPVEVALERKALMIIAVDVSTPPRTDKREIRSLLDVLDQTIGFQMEENKRRSLELADVVVSPDLKGFSAADFATSVELIDVGYRAGRAQLDTIGQGLKRRGIARAGAPRISRLDPATFDLERWRRPDVGAPLKRVGAEDGVGTPLPGWKGPASPPESLREADRQADLLYGSGLFDRVSYRVDSSAATSGLIYELEASAPTRLGMALHYDSDYRFIGLLDVLSRGVLGGETDFALEGVVGDVMGIRAELRRNLAQRRFQIVPSVGYLSQPKFFSPPDSHHTPFDLERAEVGLEGRFNLHRRAVVSIGYFLGTSQVDSLPQQLFPRGTDRRGGVRFRTRLDDLDDLYFPSRGSFQEFRLDLQHPDLADDASFRRYSAEAGYYRSVSSRATVGLGGYWGLLDGSAPFYENIFIGGRRYLGIASLPFYGLERDERQARHYAQMHLSYRHRVKSFTLGFVRSIYLQGGYELGFFNQTDALRRFQPALHGFGGGLHLRTRVVGPIQFDLGGTNQGHFGASISVGRAF